MRFAHKNPGDSPRYSHLDHNAWQDTAKAHLLADRLGTRALETPKKASGLVQVSNDEAALNRFDILGSTEVVIQPDAGDENFENEPTLLGVTPKIANHAGGRFVVLQEPAANDAIVPAVAFGYTVCRINVTNADHEYADLTDSDSTKLTSYAWGPAHIIYKEAGTGTKLAIVKLGHLREGTMMAVLVWKDGGTTNGTKIAQCDRTYTARTRDATGVAAGGVLLGTGLTPEKVRPTTGPLLVVSDGGAGVAGLGYMFPSGTFILFDANESLDTDAC